ncbi:MAG: T9SS type A sorting domain-containing protein [Fidelibacterota bacterium]
MVIARVGDEVRGYESAVWISYINDYEIFLTVNGKYESGEGITFQYFDSQNQKYSDIYFSYTFSADQVIGTVDEPLILDIAGFVPLIPENFKLYPNFPNPFNPTTEIRYNIPEDTYVQITVYNLEGRKIKTLVNEYLTSGYKKVIWDSTNDNGIQVASGVYFYQMTAGSFSDMKKMVILK